jgi:hypothetical protein
MIIEVNMGATMRTLPLRWQTIAGSFEKLKTHAQNTQRRSKWEKNGKGFL